MTTQVLEKNRIISLIYTDIFHSIDSWTKYTLVLVIKVLMPFFSQIVLDTLI